MKTIMKTIVKMCFTMLLAFITQQTVAQTPVSGDYRSAVSTGNWNTAANKI